MILCNNKMCKHINHLSLFLFLFFNLLCHANISAQPNPEDKHLPFGISDSNYEEIKLDASSPADQTNPLKLVFVLMIRFYQVFFPFFRICLAVMGLPQDRI